MAKNSRSQYPKRNFMGLPHTRGEHLRRIIPEERRFRASLCGTVRARGLEGGAVQIRCPAAAGARAPAPAGASPDASFPERKAAGRTRPHVPSYFEAVA